MLARFFIDRPVLAWVISLVIILLGAIAAALLPIAEYPEITPPNVRVTANYPGASADVVADTVAAPIEQQVNGVEGMLYMSSNSGNDGSYGLTVTFKLGTNVKNALVLVQNRVALAVPQLPAEVQRQTINIRKKNPTILLIVTITSTNPEHDYLFLSNYATIHLKEEIARLPGVGDIGIFGQKDYCIRLWLDPEKLAARNITANEVISALQTRDQVIKAMERLKENFPPGMEYEPVYDTTPFIEESINEVYKALALAVVLVALVVLVFLQSWRATLIPLAAVPVAIVGT